MKDKSCSLFHLTFHSQHIRLKFCLFWAAVLLFRHRSALPAPPWCVQRSRLPPESSGIHRTQSDVFDPPPWRHLPVRGHRSSCCRSCGLPSPAEGARDWRVHQQVSCILFILPFRYFYSQMGHLWLKMILIFIRMRPYFSLPGCCSFTRLW